MSSSLPRLYLGWAAQQNLTGADEAWDAKPVITTTQVVSGHADFTPAVIGAPSLDS